VWNRKRGDWEIPQIAPLGIMAVIKASFYIIGDKLGDKAIFRQQKSLLNHRRP